MSNGNTLTAPSARVVSEPRKAPESVLRNPHLYLLGTYYGGAMHLNDAGDIVFTNQYGNVASPGIGICTGYEYYFGDTITTKDSPELVLVKALATIGANRENLDVNWVHTPVGKQIVVDAMKAVLCGKAFARGMTDDQLHLCYGIIRNYSITGKFEYTPIQS